MKSLHLRVLTNGVTEDDLRIFFAHTQGSRYYNNTIHPDWVNMARGQVMQTEWIRLGEMCEVKEALLKGEFEKIPGFVHRVKDHIRDSLFLVNPDTIREFGLLYESAYHVGYDVISWDKLETFLWRHQRREAFLLEV